MINSIGDLVLLFMGIVVAFIVIVMVPTVLYLAVKDSKETDQNVKFREDPKAQKIFFTGLTIFLIVFGIAFLVFCVINIIAMF